MAKTGGGFTLKHAEMSLTVARKMGVLQRIPLHHHPRLWLCGDVISVRQ